MALTRGVTEDGGSLRSEVCGQSVDHSRDQRSISDLTKSKPLKTLSLPDPILGPKLSPELFERVFLSLGPARFSDSDLRKKDDTRVRHLDICDPRKPPIMTDRRHGGTGVF